MRPVKQVSTSEKTQGTGQVSCKINHAGHPLAFIEMLRRIVGHEITPEEAVRACHDVLQSTGIAPLRPPTDDPQLTSGITSYCGSGSTIVKPAGVSATGTDETIPADNTAARTRVEEQLARLRRRFGE